MSHAERTNWDRRYAAGEYLPRTSTARFFDEWLPLVLQSGPPGRALDVAAGTGRHALRLAEAGFAVDAVDISRVALEMGERSATERGLSIDWICADLDDYRPQGRYRLITVFRYRNRALWHALAAALDDSSWVLVEHHLRTTATVDGPQDDDFRVAPGELLDAFGSLRVLHYSERLEVGDRPDTVHAVVRLAACNGDPGW